MMKRLWVLAGALLLAVAGFAQTSKTLVIKPSTGPLAGRTLYSNSHALLIGVSRYAKLPADQRLRFADQDARALREVLIKSYGFPAENITLLLNEQATKDGIEKALGSFADSGRVAKDDRLLVFFSGHGQTVTLPDAGEMGFLIPYDAQVDLRAPHNAGPYLTTCVEMEGLWKYLRGSPAKHALLLADACFSGLLVQARGLANLPKLNANELAKQAARPARQVLTAGAKGEEVFEDPKLGHGAFTYKLLEELRAEAAVAGEVFTANDLATVLKRGVSNLTDGKQSPQFGNYRAEGEFLFVTTAPQPVPTLGGTERVPERVVVKPAGPQAGEVRRNPVDQAEMVWIPAGEFLMGTDAAEIDALWKRLGWPQAWKQYTDHEGPKHAVNLSNGYWMYRTEVTVAQYQKFCSAAGRQMPSPPPWGWKESDPIGKVDWNDAVAYCNWAGARLPTEAEWEYAARGGNTGLEGKPRQTFAWGEELPQSPARLGNLVDIQFRRVGSLRDMNPASYFLRYDDDYAYAAPVGSYKPNGYGLYDMAGNVSEWCADWYFEHYYKNGVWLDPRGPARATAGVRRALRGSSWNSAPSSNRLSYRTGFTERVTAATMGFRPVLRGLQ